MEPVWYAWLQPPYHRFLTASPPFCRSWCAFFCVCCSATNSACAHHLHPVTSSSSPLHPFYLFHFPLGCRHIYILVQCRILWGHTKVLWPQAGSQACVSLCLLITSTSYHRPTLSLPNRMYIFFLFIMIRYPAVLYRKLDLKQYANMSEGTPHPLLFLICPHRTAFPCISQIPPLSSLEPSQNLIVSKCIMNIKTFLFTTSQSCQLNRINYSNIYLPPPCLGNF